MSAWGNIRRMDYGGSGDVGASGNPADSYGNFDAWGGFGLPAQGISGEVAGGIAGMGGGAQVYPGAGAPISSVDYDAKFGPKPGPGYHRSMTGWVPPGRQIATNQDWDSWRGVSAGGYEDAPNGYVPLHQRQNNGSAAQQPQPAMPVLPSGDRSWINQPFGGAYGNSPWLPGGANIWGGTGNTVAGLRPLSAGSGAEGIYASPSQLPTPADPGFYAPNNTPPSGQGGSIMPWLPGGAAQTSGSGAVAWGVSPNGTPIPLPGNARPAMPWLPGSGSNTPVDHGQAIFYAPYVPGAEFVRDPNQVDPGRGGQAEGVSNYGGQSSGGSAAVPPPGSGFTALPGGSNGIQPLRRGKARQPNGLAAWRMLSLMGA